MSRKPLQQGDVNITPVDIIPGSQKVGPSIENIKKQDGGVIAEGESTGHKHRIIGTAYQLYKLGARLFARIKSKDCSIVHEEHTAIGLPPGDYEFGPTIEYDHFAERSRRVVD